MSDVTNNTSAQLDALRAAQQWQPIETAPRDGRMAIVYRPLAALSGDQPVALKRLVEYDGHCWPCTVPPGEKPCNPTDGGCHVTHWMPLPPPPREEGRDEPSERETVIPRVLQRETVGKGSAHDPLHDDAQAMALVKKFGIGLDKENESEPWIAAIHKDGNLYMHESPDLNRAICECVALMQANKEKG